MTNQENQRYEVLDRLDAGGMAEVFRGKAISLGGLEKAIAIKRVLPSLVGNDKFVKMFIDEARLSLRLSHANIVSVFDIARSGPTYFIVMEFVDGTNLKKLVDKGQPVPVGLAVLITIDVCKGLAYAHDRADNDGRPLNVVHRDVSPPNILISRKGEVKLTDFGLAKAKSQLETTDPGVVKGKFSYLSPEAARGEDVDHRADIFAAGIVLWEMLAGRRLFLGDTDMDTLKQVREAEIPPLRSLNADVPPELEEIVRRSLAKDLEHRYQSARDFAKDLSRFTVRSGIAASSFDLEVFIEDFLKSQARNAPGNAVRDELTRAVIQEEMNKLIRIEGAEGGSEPSVVKRSALVDTRMWDFDDDEEDAADDGEEGPLSTAPMGRMAANLGVEDTAAGAGHSSSAPPSTSLAQPPARPGGVGLPPPPSSRRPASPPPPSSLPPAAPAPSSSASAPSLPSPAAPPAASGGGGSPRTRSAYATRGGGNIDVLDRAPEEIRVGAAAPRVSPPRQPAGASAAPSPPEKATAPQAPAGSAAPSAEGASSGKSGQLVFYLLVAAIVLVVLYLVWMVAT